MSTTSADMGAIQLWKDHNRTISDPASVIYVENKNNNIDIIKILEKTKYGSDGMGGIITKGTMYIGYPR